MKISVLTIFPEMFISPFRTSLMQKAQKQKFLTLEYINLRDFASDTYKTVDDKPYGGGVGMILKVDIIDKALQSVLNLNKNDSHRIILLDPKGQTYDQKRAVFFSTFQHLILICCHYYGVDARVEQLVDSVISIGNYIVTGGEIPAMVIVDSVVRLLPGVLGSEESLVTESFTDEMLEYPQYTRPKEYKSMKVPEVLISGNHRHIREWYKSNLRKVYKNKIKA